ncbi:MAG: MATE family efflux transporter [Clostridia bacterium]|nr:MATE family efflux transporter [Clostridia bacterium]MBR0443879.1 MATE family efflux transporter [Clostridia bacterium]
MIRDLTEGSIPKLLLSFTLPLLLSNALQAVYNIVDMIVVGQVLGGTGMSAVSIGGEVLHFLTFLSIGFSNAGQILIARLVGEKREDDIRKMIGTIFTFLFVVAAAVSVLCIVFRHGILTVLNTPKESYPDALDYVTTCAAGLVFIYGYNIVSAILRGMGDSRRPFLFISIAAVLNIVLDVLFVAYLGMGVFGAALATVLGQGTSFLFSIVFLYRRRDAFHFDFRPESFRMDPASRTALLRLGIPMAIQSASVNFSKMLVTSWINSYGVINSAVAGIFNKLSTVINVVGAAFNATGGAMMSQNLGARRYDRVKGILGWVLLFGASISSVFSLILVLFPTQVFELFTRDSAVLLAAPVIILPCVVNFFGTAVRTMGFAMVNGSGNSRLNLLVALTDGIVARIGISALLGFAAGLGCLGFWLGDALAGYLPFLIGTGYYLSRRWMKQEPVIDGKEEKDG